MEPVIRWDRVSKIFRGEKALDAVTLDVQPGVVYALLGENGAGKTTALKIALGLTDADSGTARVLGLDSKSQGLEIRRRVGYVPEQPILYDWMTPRQVGWFVSGFHGSPAWMTYLERLQEFQIPPSRKIGLLSKGMRAKVSLALALAHDPELLILDEPTSGLDALVRREFLESMVDRAASGKTVLLSSHQIGEVERVADFVAIIREGKLIVAERLDELKAAVRLLVLTMTEENRGATPVIPGEVLELRAHGRQRRVLTRGAADFEIRQLAEDPMVETLDLQSPTLEEIFVAYMQRPPCARPTPEAVYE